VFFVELGGVCAFTVVFVVVDNRYFAHVFILAQFVTGLLFDFVQSDCV